MVCRDFLTADAASDEERRAFARQVRDELVRQLDAGLKPDSIRVQPMVGVRNMSARLLLGGHQVVSTFHGLRVVVDEALMVPFEVFTRANVPGRKLEAIRRARGIPVYPGRGGLKVLANV